MKKELSPPFKITNDILNLVYEIGELVGKISAEKEFEKTKDPNLATKVL